MQNLRYWFQKVVKYFSVLASLPALTAVHFYVHFSMLSVFIKKLHNNFRINSVSCLKQKTKQNKKTARNRSVCSLVCLLRLASVRCCVSDRTLLKLLAKICAMVPLPISTKLISVPPHPLLPSEASRKASTGSITVGHQTTAKTRSNGFGA